MKKAELRRHLQDGKCIADLFPLTSGQECEIYKADRFQSGEEIIYIADLGVQNLPLFQAVEKEDIDEVIGCCYTGDEFLQECNDNRDQAEYLFWYCDWQSPSSAYPEICEEEA